MVPSAVLVPSDAFTKLLFRMRCFPEIDIACGVYCCKNVNPPDPLIYRENGEGAFWDWTVGDLLTTKQHNIRAVHMGLTLIRVSLFSRMKAAGLVGGDGADQDEEPFFKTINTGRVLKDGKCFLAMGTEDIYFCDKARKVDCQLMVDTSVLAGHHDKGSGVTFGLPWTDGPAARAKWLTFDGQTTDKKENPDLKLALDLGAGGTRREWAGHKTFTTDLRADTKPDYVQDTRKLNLPDEHFDLIASSHHLEHIGRWDQEQVWREMFRVLRPGGKMEHVVPSVEWAGWKIKEGEVDEHVMNVLYGAQEEHGYARELNTHFFGYTKALARALAEQTGLCNVKCEDWRDREELGYNLVITGEKSANPVALKIA